MAAGTLQNLFPQRTIAQERHISALSHDENLIRQSLWPRSLYGLFPPALFEGGGMKRLPAVAVLLFAGTALAGGGTTAAGLLGQTPGLPASAQAAFGEWVFQDGSLKDGPRYAAFTQSLKQAAMSPLPGGDSGQAHAQSLAAKYATAKGQKDIASMSLAEKMELAQQMSAQARAGAGAGGPVSDSDIALIKNVQIYPRAGDVRTRTAAIRFKAADLEKQWDADSKKIDDEQNVAYSKLAICKGESGEPSDLSKRELYLRFQDKRIVLASNYLPKFSPLVAELKTTVMPEVVQGDKALASWGRISDAGQKSRMRGVAQGARNSAIADAGVPFGLVRDVSQKAATAVAHRKQIETTYAHASGC
jgi:hypothetical protein